MRGQGGAKRVSRAVRHRGVRCKIALFYLGGAKLETVERKRRSLRSFLADVIADVID